MEGAEGAGDAARGGTDAANRLTHLIKVLGKTSSQVRGTAAGGGQHGMWQSIVLGLGLCRNDGCRAVQEHCSVA